MSKEGISRELNGSRLVYDSSGLGSVVDVQALVEHFSESESCSQVQVRLQRHESLHVSFIYQGRMNVHCQMQLSYPEVQLVCSSTAGGPVNAIVPWFRNASNNQENEHALFEAIMRCATTLELEEQDRRAHATRVAKASPAVLESMINFAEHHPEQQTGGELYGVWYVADEKTNLNSEAKTQVVLAEVDAVTGPGPKSMWSVTQFEQDEEFQLANQIAFSQNGLSHIGFWLSHHSLPRKHPDEATIEYLSSRKPGESFIVAIVTFEETASEAEYNVRVRPYWVDSITKRCVRIRWQQSKQAALRNVLEESQVVTNALNQSMHHRHRPDNTSKRRKHKKSSSSSRRRKAAAALKSASSPSSGSFFAPSSSSSSSAKQWYNSPSGQQLLRDIMQALQTRYCRSCVLEAGRVTKNLSVSCEFKSPPQLAGRIYFPEDFPQTFASVIADGVGTLVLRHQWAATRDERDVDAFIDHGVLLLQRLTDKVELPVAATNEHDEHNHSDHGHDYSCAYIHAHPHHEKSGGGQGHQEHRFKQGEEVDGMDAQGKWYTAVVQDIQHIASTPFVQYLLHFRGFDEECDELVDPSRVAPAGMYTLHGAASQQIDNHMEASRPRLNNTTAVVPPPHHALTMEHKSPDRRLPQQQPQRVQFSQQQEEQHPPSISSPSAVNASTAVDEVVKPSDLHLNNQWYKREAGRAILDAIVAQFEENDICSLVSVEQGVKTHNVSLWLNVNADRAREELGVNSSHFLNTSSASNFSSSETSSLTSICVVFPWDFPTEHAQLSMPGTATVHVKHSWDYVEFTERSAAEFVAACVQMLPALDSMTQGQHQQPLSNNPAASFFALSSHAANDSSIPHNDTGAAWHLSADGRSNMDSIFKFMSLRYYRTHRCFLSEESSKSPATALSFSNARGASSTTTPQQLVCVAFQSRIALAELAKLRETKSIESNKHYSVLNCQVVFPEDFPEGAAVLYTSPTEEEFVNQTSAEETFLSESECDAIRKAMQHWGVNPSTIMPVVNYRSTVWFRRSDKQKSLGYEFVTALADPVRKAHTRSFTVSFTNAVTDAVDNLQHEQEQHALMFSSNRQEEEEPQQQQQQQQHHHHQIDSHHVAPMLI